MAPLLEIAQVIEDTLRDVGFDLKFLGDYLNKPGDADYLFVEVRVETDRLIVQCLGCHISIDSPTEVSANGGTVRIFRAAKVSFVNECDGWVASLTTTDDEIVGHWMNIWGVQTPRVPRDAMLGPIAELVGVFRRSTDANGNESYTDIG